MNHQITNILNPAKSIIPRLVVVIAGILLFLFSLNLMGQAFQNLSRNVVDSILIAASNPFISLFIGLLITALIQSSSTSTTLIVTAVASGSISFNDAVPMIMGANVGTTITSTIISLGFISKKNEFSRAISAGVVHDFFNILVVLILFPLEFKYKFLSGLSRHISSLFVSDSAVADVSTVHFKFFDLSALTNWYTSLVDNSTINLIVSFILLFVSIKIIARYIYNFLIGEQEQKLRQYIFKGPAKSFMWGTLFTAGIQSSSITTSIVVPLVATGKIKLKAVTPFIIGANIGTTITAFIAVIFESYAVVNIALVHLLFNVIGVFIFLFVPFSRNLLIKLAVQFGVLAAKYRITVAIYILVVFFIIPFTLIYLNKGF